MLKKIILTLTILLLSACSTNTNDLKNQEDNIRFDGAYSINEIGIFGIINNDGVTYYDFNQDDNIQLLENTDNEKYRIGYTTGFALYQDKLYSFQRKEESHETVLNVKDIDGKNSKDLIEIPLKGYSTSLIGTKCIYYKQKIIFNATYFKLSEDSDKNAELNQLLMYDIQSNTLHEITPLYNSKEKSVNLYRVVDNRIIFSESTKSEHSSYEDYETTGKDVVWQTEEAIKSMNHQLYIYNIDTYKSESFFNEKGIDISPYECISKSDFLYRKGNEVFAINIGTKETRKLFDDENIIQITSCLDNKVFYSTYNDGIWCVKYYDLENKSKIQYGENKMKENEAPLLFLTHENTEYFIGIYNDQGAVISKKDFYSQDFNNIKKMNW